MIELPKTNAAKTFEWLIELKDQRDRAIACAALSFCISAALISTNFPENRKPIDDARQAVTLHRKLFAEAEALLQANQQVLKENVQALADVRRAAETH